MKFDFAGVQELLVKNTNNGGKLQHWPIKTNNCCVEGNFTAKQRNWLKKSGDGKG